MKKNRGSDGRKTRRRDPRATRASIRGAAEKIFVERGFAGTSMSDVAAAAGVTKSLIHHHFGSKEDLWTEVKKKRLSRYAKEQAELTSRDDSGVAVLRESIEKYFRFLQQNPEYVRLATWMMLEDPRLSQASYPELVQGGVARIRIEQKAGRLRDDVEPEHLLAQFISLCMHWLTARDTTLASLVESCGESSEKNGGDVDSRYLDSLIKVFFEGALPRTQ